MKTKYAQAIALVMILLLVMSASLVVIYGAKLVQAIQDESQIELYDRSIRLYFNQRLKQSDKILGIEVLNNQLIINENDYFILLYEEEGMLIEQISNEKIKLESAGQAIAPIQNLEIELNLKTIIIHYQNINGETISLVYTLRAGGQNE